MSDEVQRLLERQLAMTRETWRTLREHGVNEDDELSLEFFFTAPSYSTAMKLKAFLEQETDYGVGVRADQDKWTVYGSTQNVPLSLAILEQWVDWMVSAGTAHETMFDGWGAEAP
jgi:Regulator of ribonuclease activity B